MEKYDVVAMGELLIDFTQNGYSEQGNPIFEANPGGAPCNVLAMLQKLGRKTAFIGKVGQDGFGLQLEKALKETGISTEGLCFDKEVHTTLAVVQKKEDGDRDFSFYRKPGADMMLRKEEVKEELIRNAKIFHYGSLSLTDEQVRTATVRSAWAGVNIFCIFVGLIISVICVKNRDSRNVINIISTTISSFWVLLMGGIVVLALIIGFVQ